MNKLIKLSDTHYVIVDDSEIKEGDWFLPISGIGWELNKPRQADSSGGYSNGHCTKITHSTQSLGIGWQQEVIELSLQEVKELIGEVDVEKKALEISPVELDEDEFDVNETHRVTWIDGYTQAIEDNKDNIDKILDFLILKMESISQDMIDKDSLHLGRFRAYKQIYETIKPKTQWDVEFDLQGKLKLKK